MSKIHKTFDAFLFAATGLSGPYPYQWELGTEEAEMLLTALSVYKIQRVLRDGLRLRTACDLEPSGAVVIKRPESFTLPSVAELEKELPVLIKAASTSFASPVVTEVKYITA